MIVYSKTRLNLFKEASDRAGGGHLLTGVRDDFLAGLKDNNEYILIDIEEQDDVNYFTVDNGALLSMIVGAGFTKKVIVVGTDTGIEEPLISMLSQQKVHLEHVQDPLTENILNRLFILDDPQTYYGKQGETTPLTNTKPKNTSEMYTSIFKSIIDGISYTATNIDDVKNIHSKIRANSDYLSDKVDVTNSASIAHQRAIQTVTDLAIAEATIATIPSIIEAPAETYRENLKDAERIINETLRKREAEQDKDKIIEYITGAREAYSVVKLAMRNNDSSLNEIVRLISDSNPPSIMEITEIAKSAPGIFTPDEAIQLIEKTSLVNTKRNETIEHVSEKLRALKQAGETIERGMDKVVQGYEAATTMSLSVIDKLASKSSIMVEVKDTIQKYTTLVYGVNGTGVTNFAASTAISSNKSDGGKTVVIDMKPDSQLHYYAPYGKEFSEFLSLTIDQIEEIIEEHFEHNNYMMITNAMLQKLLADATMSKVSELLGCLTDLLTTLSNKKINTYVISDNASPMHNQIQRKVASVFLVTDTNPSNVKKLTPWLTKLKGYQNVQVKTVVVTRCDNIPPTTILNNSGVPVAGCRHVAIRSHGTIDVCKMNGKLHALDYTWGYTNV